VALDASTQHQREWGRKKKTRKITVALLGHCHSCREGDVPEQKKVYAAWGRETFP